MAHNHPRGQIVVETAIVVLVLAVAFILIATHLTAMKNKFEKVEITSEVKSEAQRFYRKK